MSKIKVGVFGYMDNRCISKYIYEDFGLWHINSEKNGRCLLEAAHAGLCVNADGIKWDWRFPKNSCGDRTIKWPILAIMAGTPYNIKLPLDSNDNWSKSKIKDWRCSCNDAFTCKHIKMFLNHAMVLIRNNMFPYKQDELNKLNGKFFQWTVHGVDWLNKHKPFKLTQRQCYIVPTSPMQQQVLKAPPIFPGVTKNPSKKQLPLPIIPKIFVSVKNLSDINDIVNAKRGEAFIWKQRGNNGAVADIMVALAWDLEQLSKHPSFRHLNIPTKLQPI